MLEHIQSNIRTFTEIPLDLFSLLPTSPQSTETAEKCKGNADTQPDTAPAVEGDTGHAHHHGHHHGHAHSHGQHDGNHDGADQQGVRQQGHEQLGGDSQRQDRLDLGQQAVNEQQMAQQAQVAFVRPWVAEKARWKSKHSWQWTAGSDNEASPKASWCWHWRRLFGEAGSEQPVSLWHCDEALPASWQWHGMIGDAVNNVRETWQWRPPPADWQQPQPTQWAWPPGVSWGWEQL